MNSATTIAVIAIVLVFAAALYSTVRSLRSGGCSGCNRRCCCNRTDHHDKDGTGEKD